MTRCWKLAALAAAWLALSAAARAQPGCPSPVGAARLPDPIRYNPGPIPDLVPGPVTPAMAPVGPPQTLNLSANHTGAFQCENFPTESACYASIGAQALQRQKLMHLPVAFTDNQSRGIDTGNVPIGIGTAPNGSFNPLYTNPNVLPQALNFNDITPALLNGGRLTVGYLLGNQAWEFTGFLAPTTSAQAMAYNPGRLFVPFGPVNAAPTGFDGTNGLTLQADQVRATFSSSVASAELNHRRWDSGINGVEMIFGFRYFYAQERASIWTDDAAATRDVFGNSNPTQQSTYSSTVYNNLIALQFGGEYSTPLPHSLLGWIWLGGYYKGALGPNIVERTQNLTRGDGMQGFNVTHTSVLFSGLNDASLFVDFHILERMRLRAGYMALWAVNFSQAASQVNYDLSHPGSRGVDHGSIFYHGPMVELQFLF